MPLLYKFLNVLIGLVLISRTASCVKTIAKVGSNRILHCFRLVLAHHLLLFHLKQVVVLRGNYWVLAYFVEVVAHRCVTLVQTDSL